MLRNLKAVRREADKRITRQAVARGDRRLPSGAPLRRRTNVGGQHATERLISDALRGGDRQYVTNQLRVAAVRGVDVDLHPRDKLFVGMRSALSHRAS